MKYRDIFDYMDLAKKAKNCSLIQEDLSAFIATAREGKTLCVYEEKLTEYWFEFVFRKRFAKKWDKAGEGRTSIALIKTEFKEKSKGWLDTEIDDFPFSCEPEKKRQKTGPKQKPIDQMHRSSDSRRISAAGAIMSESKESDKMAFVRSLVRDPEISEEIRKGLKNVLENKYSGYSANEALAHFIDWMTIIQLISIWEMYHNDCFRAV